MKIDYPKPLGISLVGWSVSISNILLFVSYYYILMTQQTPAPSRFIDFISMAAVFPHDFFHNYLTASWSAHLCWIFVITICAFGILLLNGFARMVFIIMGITHGVVLAYIFFMHCNEPDALDYFFKFYFNCTFIFSYVGFITIPEVRLQFKSPLERWRIHFWFEKKLGLPREVQDAKGYYNLALAYSRLHRDSDAIASLEKSIRIDPGDMRYYYEIGLLYAKQKNSSGAIQALKEALRINPGHFEATFRLAQLYQQEGCGREAVEFLEKAAQLQPNNSQVYRHLGQAYMLTDKFPQAVAALQKSLRFNSRDADAYYYLGWIFLNKIGKAEEAREALRAAVHLKRDMSEGHFQLGMACLKLHRYKDAVRAFKDVINLEEGHGQALYQLGFAYTMLKDLNSAQRQSQILRELDSDLVEKLNLLISAVRKETA